MDAEYYRDLLRPLLNRKWLIPGVPLAAVTPMIAELRREGAPKPFVIANGLGTGDLPDRATADWVVLDIEADTVMGELRATSRALGDLPPHVLDRVEAWDPDHEAAALGHPFVTHTHVAGRRVFGGRPPAFEALEDKMLADGIWDGATVPRAPAAVVPATQEALVAAHDRLDRGEGTVWSGDTHEGFNGGAEYLRWVNRDEAAHEAVAFFAAHCRRVRIMPFLEGIPCSVHAVVFPTETVALRPCEIIVLREPGSSKLRYCGTATYWDPNDADAEAMRAAAVRVGDWLRAHHDYRGALTVDGVMTVDGFRPTELNSRPGGAMNGVVGAVEGLPFEMMQRTLIERLPLDYRPEHFRRLVMTASETNRSGRGLHTLARTATETTRVEVTADATGRLSRAEDGEAGDAGTLELGPHPIGALVFHKATGSHAPTGRPFAPRVVAAFRLADEIWKTGIGEVTSAPPVR